MYPPKVTGLIEMLSNGNYLDKSQYTKFKGKNYKHDQGIRN